MLVLSGSGTVSDIALYAAGLKDPAKLDEMMKKYLNNESLEADTEISTFEYKDFLGIEFKVLNACERYSYDKEYGIYVDRSQSEGYMKALLDQAETLTVVGVVQPNGEDTTFVSTGFNYLPELVYDTMEKAAESEIVKAQMANPEINVFTGKPFGDKGDTEELDLFSFITFDSEELEKLFSFDPSALDFSTIDFSDFDLTEIDFSAFNVGDISKDMDLSSLFTEEEIQEIFRQLMAIADEDTVREVLSGVMEAFTQYLTENYSEEMQEMARQMVEYTTSEALKSIVTDYLTEIMEGQEVEMPSEEDLERLITMVTDDFLAYSEEHIGEEPEEIIRGYFMTDSFMEIAKEFVKVYLEAQEITFDPSVYADELLEKVTEGYTKYAEENGYFSPDAIVRIFTDFLSSEAIQKVIINAIEQSDGYQQVKAYIQSILEKKMAEINGQLSNAMKEAMGSLTTQITAEVTKMMTSAVSQMTEKMKESFTFDPEALQGLVSFDMDAEQMKDLFTSMFSTDSSSYTKNLSNLNYGSQDEPSSVSIYPLNFEAKDSVVSAIEEYNNAATERGEKDKVIHYTDYVGSLMSSVTEIVDVISYVLIAFVAISLVVSSIMIGIITYVSVIERTREIGILRALGASKRNIANVFNAETFIIGLLAGSFGVGITLLLLIPGNLLLKSLTEGQDVQAVLPVGAAFILIGISIFLTLLGGFLPARKASKMDPVTALRTE